VVEGETAEPKPEPAAVEIIEPDAPRPHTDLPLEAMPASVAAAFKNITPHEVPGAPAEPRAPRPPIPPRPPRVISMPPVPPPDDEPHPVLAPEIMPRPRSKKRTNRFALYFLGFAFIFFLAAAGAAAYLFLEGANTISSQNIGLSVEAPALIDAGKPAVLQFTIDNHNEEALQGVTMTITYPDGTRDATNTTEVLSQQTMNVGDIAAGASQVQTSSAAFFGAEGSSQTVSVELDYRLVGSDAIFTKDASASITIGSSPVSISFSAPQEAISGQSFAIDATVGNNSTETLKNVALEAQFPFGFSLTSSSPAASVGGQLWRLGDLAPGASDTVHLTGTLTGDDGDSKVFQFSAGSETDLTEAMLAVPLLTSPLTITVEKPFLSGTILVGGNTGATLAASEDGSIAGAVDWQNNLDEDVQNAVFTLSISGAYDPSQVTTNGFYDSSKSEIVWSSQTDPALADVPAGAHGTFAFSIGTTGAVGTVLANPHVDLMLSVTASRTGQGAVPETVTNAASTRINLASALELSADALHFTGAFTDTGPMPPVHNETTYYTVVWSIKNPSNDVGNGSVTATLPLYIEFSAASPGSGITYDASTRTVTWSPGDIPAGTGVTTPATSASFEVALTPSVSQVGQDPSLTSSATFTGQDRYAQTQITTTAPAPTTQLASDPKFVQGMDAVK
ncbi:MAG: hypothetical protein ACREGH_04020, partial [Minisyncoccia bacterium]